MLDNDTCMLFIITFSYQTSRTSRSEDDSQSLHSVDSGKGRRVKSPIHGYIQRSKVVQNGGSTMLLTFS